MLKKQRVIYGIGFAVLLLTEVLIALFVHDFFVRPYVGDVLVTVLLCCLCRTVMPKGLSALPLYVFVFATLVEVAQYFNVVTLLGVQDNPVLRTIIGTSFSFADLLCYAVGCFAFWTAEKFVIKRYTDR